MRHGKPFGARPAMTAAPYTEALTRIIDEVVRPSAAEIDATGTYPKAAIEELGAAGLLGLVSAEEVGGGGGGRRRHDLAGAAGPA